MEDRDVDDFPDVHFGALRKEPVDWRGLDNEEEWDDDEELEETPPDVIAMLGFDPLQPSTGKLIDAEDEWMAALDELLAFDYQSSNRRIDLNGHLHVAVANISKACINPYWGREIPEWQKLGLDPDKKYQLYRDPHELIKAADSFNGKPILALHKPVAAQAHPKHIVVGATGTDAEFVAPYLKNSLVIWTQDEINDIETDVKKQLSCGYRYRADMTPGIFEGEHYDGVMRDIVGNHVALVREGRAGSDVVVADSKEETQDAREKADRSVPQGGRFVGRAGGLPQAEDGDRRQGQLLSDHGRSQEGRLQVAREDDHRGPFKGTRRQARGGRLG